MDINIVTWAAHECARQQSGEVSVAHMCNAWEYACTVRTAPTLECIKTLGYMVEPQQNATGFRRIPVVFANGNRGVDHREIVGALTRLVEVASPVDDPLAFYEAFEKIHPFADGNGRVGSILYNWGNLRVPTAPPAIFQTERPRCSCGADDAGPSRLHQSACPVWNWLREQD